MGTASKTQGTILNRETSPASGTFTAIGGVTGLNWPSHTTAMADTTLLNAVSAHTSQIPTLSTLGDCTFTLEYDSADATQEQLNADAVAHTSRLYKIVGSDTGAADWRFDAWVTSFVITNDKGSTHQAAVTLSPTGVVTRA